MTTERRDDISPLSRASNDPGLFCCCRRWRQMSSLDGGGGDCLLDALPMDVIDAEIASRHPWIVYHLAMAYKRYADHCRRVYAVLPDDAIRRWRVIGTANITCALSSSVFNDVAVNCVALPSDHPRLRQFLRDNKEKKKLKHRCGYDNDELVAIAAHCFAGDGPSTMVNAGFVWRHRYGELHNGPYDVPAVQQDIACQLCAARVCRREWYRGGKRHRDDNLPAIVLLTIATDDAEFSTHVEKHMRFRTHWNADVYYGDEHSRTSPLRIDAATRNIVAYFSTARWRRGGVKRAEIDGVKREEIYSIRQWWRDGTFHGVKHIRVSAAEAGRRPPCRCVIM